jgi:hypothetical protein
MNKNASLQRKYTRIVFYCFSRAIIKRNIGIVPSSKWN